LTVASRCGSDRATSTRQPPLEPSLNGRVQRFGLHRPADEPVHAGGAGVFGSDLAQTQREYSGKRWNFGQEKTGQQAGFS
jgi:hypothetical protein